MRLLVALTVLIAASAAGPAFAQSTQGRWECHGAASADPTKPAPHGLLAIFGQSYSYTASDYQDPLSGVGDVEQEESGIGFVNGPLADPGGVEVGQIDTGAGTVAMDLLGKNGVVLTCLAM